MASGFDARLHDAQRHVWTDDTLAREPYIGTYACIPTTGPMPKYQPTKPTRRQKLERRITNMRTAIATKIAPWLDDVDDWY